MTALLFTFEGLFLLKILWNLSTPYVLAMEPLKPDAERTRGISLMPWVEVTLLLLASVVSCIANETSSFQHPKSIAIWGVAAIVGSYVHIVIGGAIAGWIVSLLRARGRSI